MLKKVAHSRENCSCILLWMPCLPTKIGYLRKGEDHCLFAIQYQRPQLWRRTRTSIKFYSCQQRNVGRAQQQEKWPRLSSYRISSACMFIMYKDFMMESMYLQLWIKWVHTQSIKCLGIAKTTAGAFPRTHTTTPSSFLGPSNFLGNVSQQILNPVTITTGRETCFACSLYPFISF